MASKQILSRNSTSSNQKNNQTSGLALPLKKWTALSTMAALALGLSACGSQKQENTVTNADGSATTVAKQDVTLLNVSYDISRDFYKAYNPLFVQHYNAVHPESKITIQQSHGGSSKQALSVANGLQADVATMNQGSDIELLQKKGLVDSNWSESFGNHSVPFTSTTVLLVRKDNQKILKTGVT